MEQREHGHRKRSRQRPSEYCDVAENDFISKMPDDIIYRIQGMVEDVKEIGRTSVLAKRWLHAWRTYPDRDLNVVMGERIACIEAKEWKKRGTLDHGLYEGRRTRVMDKFIEPFIANHVPNISRVRKFSFFGFLSLTFLCKCIRWLVDAHVNNLHLEIMFGTSFNMPGAFYKCYSLHELDLRCIPWSPSLGGSGQPNANNVPYIRFDLERLTSSLNLQSLRILVLLHVKFIGDPYLLENYFTTKYFPHLMKMELVKCGVMDLSINCQKLEQLKLVLLDPRFLNISGDGIKRLIFQDCFRTSSDVASVNVSAPNVEYIEWFRSDIPYMI